MSVEDAEVLTYEYLAEKETTRQQVNLSMNTFSFLMEGHKEVHSNVESIAIANTDFILMRAGKCLMTEKFADSNSHYRSILLFFSNEAVSQFTRKYAISISDKGSTKNVLSISYDEYLRSFAESLKSLDRLSEQSRNKLLKVKFEELMLYLTDQLGQDFLTSLMIDVNEYDFHFQQVVENNKLNKLTLSELAFLSNMSLSTFKRKFEKHFQTSPSRWFQERRLEHAALLLKNEKKRPSDIYIEVGYDTLANFIQAFKSQYGLTPKQYQLSF